VVYCINSSLLLYIKQKPTGIKRGPTDEKKKTKDINNNFISLLVRHVTTVIFGCWENQRKPGLNTKMWTRTMHFALFEDTVLAV
jgi:hypothetical protein